MIQQPATRGRSRCIGFTHGELSHCPFSYTVNGCKQTSSLLRLSKPLQAGSESVNCDERLHCSVWTIISLFLFLSLPYQVDKPGVLFRTSLLMLASLTCFLNSGINIVCCYKPELLFKIRFTGNLEIWF